MNTSTEPIPGKNIDLESPTHKYVLQSPQGPDKERMFHTLAQLVEQLTFNQWVTGSSPVRVIYAGVAELADAPDLGSGA